MENILPFEQGLDTIGKLSIPEQEGLIDIMNRKIIEHRREQIASEIRESQFEFQAGKCKEASPMELMEEILS